MKTLECQLCFKIDHINIFCFREIFSDHGSYNTFNIESNIESTVTEQSSQENNLNVTIEAMVWNIRPVSYLKVWVHKTDLVCQEFLSSLNTNHAGTCYLNSEYTRHITGSNDFPPNLIGVVTYGGGTQGKALNKGTLNSKRSPDLMRVCWTYC